MYRLIVFMMKLNYYVDDKDFSNALIRALESYVKFERRVLKLNSLNDASPASRFIFGEKLAQMSLELSKIHNFIVDFIGLHIGFDDKSYEDRRLLVAKLIGMYKTCRENSLHVSLNLYYPSIYLAIFINEDLGELEFNFDFRELELIHMDSCILWAESGYYDIPADPDISNTSVPKAFKRLASILGYETEITVSGTFHYQGVYAVMV